MLPLTVALFASVAIAGPTPDRTYSLLSSGRDNLYFVPYTRQEKESVAEGIHNLFTVYVHRDKKIKDYDQEYRQFAKQTIDPVPRSAEMLQKGPDMTDKEFHYAYVDLFSSLRDLHTNYEMPAPHSCYGFVQAVDFNLVQDSKTGAKDKLVVSSFASQPEISTLSPEALQMNIGDHVLTIDGKTFKEYVETVKWETGGAGESGALRQALSYLSARYGMMAKVPVNDHVTYQIQSFNDPTLRYNVTLPWILSRRDTCYNNFKTFQEALNKTRSPQALKNRFGHRTNWVEVERKIKKNLNSMTNIHLDFYKESFQPAPLKSAQVKFHPTSDPIVKWAIYAPETKNLGVIAISSFEPLDSNVSQLIKLIRGLLLNELKDTDSLLLDMRDNGGGQIMMADQLPQLFGPSKLVEPGQAHAIVSPANNYIFVNSTDSADPWYRATLLANSGETYSPLIQFTTVERANLIGAAYVKPVGYFHNGNCFSACDLMAANMQDNSVSTIFSEDLSSGAGGANVVEYGDFLSVVASEYFPKFPNADISESGPLNARVSWRQSIRVGTNYGSIIEDDGIVADVQMIRPSELDLIPGTTSNSQYDFISDQLRKIGKKNGKYGRYFQATPESFAEFNLGQPLVFNVDVKGVSKIQIFDSSNQPVGTPLVLTEKEKRQQRQIRVDPKLDRASYKTYQIRGYDESNAMIFTTSRTIRFLPSPATHLNISNKGNMTLDLNNGPEMAQYDLHTPRGLGFVANGTDMQVGGTGANYANNVDTQRSFFINCQDGGFNVHVLGVYDTELKFDYLHVGYKQDTKVVEFLKTPSGNSTIDGISGKGVLDNTYHVPGFSGGVTELFVRFVSDAGVVKPGVVIEKIELTI